MKKIAAVSILGMLFLSIALPLSWAVESEAKGTGMSGTPEEFSDMEKTLKQNLAPIAKDIFENIYFDTDENYRSTKMSQIIAWLDTLTTYELATKTVAVFCSDWKTAEAIMYPEGD